MLTDRALLVNILKEANFDMVGQYADKDTTEET